MNTENPIHQVRYYKGRRVSWNCSNRLWWFKVTMKDKTREERCRNTLRSACEMIERNLQGGEV